ncbi:sh2 domain-containing protein 1b-like [Scleropages formosus]|uniref:Sh2 domain-containing protein 1b-like n=1 Tax=Scleropages formosus TaxID=113540 RepID=A0A0P7WK25_SCLFO|nr:sh2 domain-containing protein 1b-like [Scleropages formosus]
MGKEGAYLIRDSETIQGALCLCVYKQKVVYTYRILQTHGGNYTLQASSGVEEKFFETLPDLIKNYKRRNQGLATRLRYSVKRQKDLETDSVSDEQLDYESNSSYGKRYSTVQVTVVKSAGSPAQQRTREKCKERDSWPCGGPVSRIISVRQERR